jgi:hypothetical protein
MTGWTVFAQTGKRSYRQIDRMQSPYKETNRMRMTRYVVAGLFLLGLLTSLLFAADISGKWTGDSDQGPSFTFTLKTDNNKLTGTMLSQEGKELPIADGKLDGDNLSFSVASEWQGQPIKLVATGKVTGDQIQLHIGTDDGSWGTDTALKRATAK